MAVKARKKPNTTASKVRVVIKTRSESLADVSCDPAQDLQNPQQQQQHFRSQIPIPNISIENARASPATTQENIQTAYSHAASLLATFDVCTRNFLLMQATVAENPDVCKEAKN
mmetsp:Transcript_80/g.211  ORF Transcript_80/g.211 Transcript_80/m.211 type:complete len:114 (+) Transcript_80:196-537(+)